MTGAKRAASLAMLELPAQEQAALAPQLAALTEMVRHLPGGAAPPPPRSPMPLREDAPAPSLPRAAVLQNAACTQEGFFLIGGRKGTEV